MNSKCYRSVFALGPCALLLTPLGVSAQAVPDAKPVEAGQQSAAPARPTEAYTLRFKFKQGDINRYKTQIKTSVTTPGLGGDTKTTDTNATSVSEQKTTKLLDVGAGEIVTTTTAVKVEVDGKPSDAPKIAPVTTQVTPAGKVLSTKSEDDSSTDAMKAVFASLIATPQSFLPEGAVKVGDKWTQKAPMPGDAGGKERAVECSFTRLETVNGVKTALIHAIMKTPMLIYLDNKFQPTKVEGDAITLLEGTLVANMDINFVIEEGRIARTVSSGNSDIFIKIGKAAPAEAAALIPADAKLTIKMSLNTSLLAPGEKVDLSPAEAVKPTTVKPEEPIKK